jgi:hypothetical protein
MSIKRSEFLRLSAWGFVATLLPIHQVKALSFITELNTFNQNDHALAVNKAKLAKEAFFNKNYSNAETLYLECIALAPADIRFYDNLENVYGAQGKWLLTVELFKNALLANPNKIAFYDRAARSLMRLELGYKSLALQYRNDINSVSLLQDAKQLYNQALQIAPDTKYLKIGKKKVKQKINTNAININYRTNIEVKEARKQRRKKHKRRYKQFSIEELISKLQNIDAKSRNLLYFDNELNTRNRNIIKEKKLINLLLSKKYKKNNQFLEAIEYANAVHTLDPKDTRSILLLKRLYKRTNDYSGLVNFQRIRNNNKDTLFSHLGLMSALNLKFKKEIQDYNLLSESINIGEDLIQNWGLLDSQKINVSDNLAEAYMLNGSYQNSKDLLKNVIETTSTTSSGGINTLIGNYARSHYKNGEYEKTKNILMIAIKDNEANSEELEYITELTSKKEDNSFNKNLRLYYLLYRTYKKSGETDKMAIILQKLIQNNPEDKFALKRL